MEKMIQVVQKLSQVAWRVTRLDTSAVINIARLPSPPMIWNATKALDSAMFMSAPLEYTVVTKGRMR